jgi:amino acid transporter
MKQHYGFWTLTFLVIANMVGAGVFTTSGFSLKDLGSPHMVLLAWAAGGVIALTGAVSFGMLARAIPESGGEYLFLSRGAHPLLGFIAGWVSLIAGFSGAIAFAATAFEAYLVPERIRPPWLPGGSVAIGAIVLGGTLHGLHPRLGALAQNTVVLLKLGLLAAILVFATTQLPTGRWHGLHTTVDGPTGWALVSAFAGSLVWISLSYAGFNAAVYVAGEVDEARKIVPKALLAGTAIVLILYLLLNAVFVYAPKPDSIKGVEDVAAIAANSLGGRIFETFVRLTIAACLLTSVFSMMMAAPRVYAKMADDGLMPGALRFHNDAPLEATVFQVILAVVFVVITTLQGLLSYLGLTLSLSSACSVFCLFLATVRNKPLLHPVHLIPALYIVCTIAAAAIMTIRNPWQLLGTLLTFSVGAMVYGIVRMFAKPPPRGQIVTKSLLNQDDNGWVESPGQETHP